MTLFIALLQSTRKKRARKTDQQRMQDMAEALIAAQRSAAAQTTPSGPLVGLATAPATPAPSKSQSPIPDESSIPNESPSPDTAIATSTSQYLSQGL